MMPRVRVQQFGSQFKIRVDGKITYIDQLTTMCNCGSVKLRKMLHHENREKLVIEAILKKEWGIPFACKTYWKGIVPMWIPLVVVKTGLNKGTAAQRINDWLKGGTYGRMMRPKYLQTPGGHNAAK